MPTIRVLFRRSAVVRSRMALLVIAGALTAGCSTGPSEAPPASSRAAPYQDWTAVAVGDIVTTIPYDGVVAPSSTLSIQSTATGTVTRIPPVGQQVSPGDAVAYIDEIPVVALPGDIPVYRDLIAPEAGDLRGGDVQQVQQFLRDQGFFGGVINGRFSTLLGSAIKDWRLQHGLSDARAFLKTEIVFIPGSGPWSITKTDTSLGASFPGGPLVDIASSGTAIDVSLDRPAPEQANYVLVPSAGDVSTADLALAPVAAATRDDDGAYSLRLQAADATNPVTAQLGSAVVIEQRQVLATAVLVIPVAAVRLDPRGSTIAKCRDAGDASVSDCAITLGTSNGTSVEVVTGLVEGQEVAVTP